MAARRCMGARRRVHRGSPACGVGPRRPGRPTRLSTRRQPATRRARRQAPEPPSFVVGREMFEGKILAASRARSRACARTGTDASGRGRASSGAASRGGCPQHAPTSEAMSADRPRRDLLDRFDPGGTARRMTRAIRLITAGPGRVVLRALGAGSDDVENLRTLSRQAHLKIRDLARRSGSSARSLDGLRALADGRLPGGRGPRRGGPA